MIRVTVACSLQANGGTNTDQVRGHFKVTIHADVSKKYSYHMLKNSSLIFRKKCQYSLWHLTFLRAVVTSVPILAKKSKVTVRVKL